MAVRALATKPSRKPLSRKRVLRAAVAHADKHGLEELSMRNLAEVCESLRWRCIATSRTRTISSTR